MRSLWYHTSFLIVTHDVRSLLKELAPLLAHFACEAHRALQRRLELRTRSVVQERVDLRVVRRRELDAARLDREDRLRARFEA